MPTSYETPIPESPAARELVGRVLAATAAHTGRHFFAALVRAMAEAMGVRYAFACELLPAPAPAEGAEGGVRLSGTARALAGWDGAGPVEPFDYALAGTPCERVVRGDVCHYPSGVADLFPGVALLAQMDARRYTGVALLDPAGEPVGLLAIVHDRDDEPSAVPDDIAIEALRVCAARASAELLRLRREEASRDVELRFRALAEASPVGIFLSDARGRCAYVNPRVTRILGLTAADALGDGWRRNIHPEDRARVLAQAADATGAQGPSTSEHRFLHPDGRVVWVHAQVQPDRDAAGRVVGYFGTVIDLTERRLAEERLRASEQRYQALAENSAVGIWQVTFPDGRTTYINPTMRQMLQLADGDDLVASGEPYEAFFTPESLATMRGEHAARSHGLSSSYEAELVGRRGGRTSVLISGSPAVGPDGALAGLIGTFTDITERKRAEEALRGSEARLRLLAEQVPAVVWTTDAALRFTSGMGAGLRHLGVRSDQYLGYDVAQIYGPAFRSPTDGKPGTDGTAAIEAHRWALAGEARTYEQAWAGRTFHSHVEPLRDAAGGIVGVIGVGLDITDRQRAEAALRQQTELLRSIVDHIPVMLNLMGPDDAYVMLNREFTRVLGWTREQLIGRDVLAECYPDPEQRRRVREFVVAAEGRWADFKTRVRDGRVIDTAWTNVPLSGGLTLGIGQDISARKAVEEELRQNKLSLETRVRERTAELSAAVEALRGEVEQRRRAEEDLRQSQQRYASILNSQQTLVSRSEPTGLITYQNAAHERVYGRRVGQSIMAHVHPDDAEATDLAMAELTKPPYTFTLEQRCMAEGRWRTFLWQVGVVRDRAGQITEFQGVGFDITERRRAEEMLRQSTRRAREIADEARAAADRERSAADEARQVAEFNRRLALEVDHRVRNNLAALLSLVGMMRGQTRDVASFATAIEGRLTAMSHVHQVLAEANWRAVDLRALVASLMNAGARLCQHTADATLDGPAVAISARQTPPLSMILMEWFTNSCKYGAHSVPGGRLSVTWQLVTRQTPENVVAPFVRLRWAESGGPPVRAAGPPSLGTLLVQGFAKLELKGTCDLRFPDGGADHMLEFPVGEEDERVRG